MRAVYEVCGERKTSVDFTVRSASARPRTFVKRTKLTFRSIVPAAACVATLSIASPSVEVAAQESPLTAIISEISQREADVNRINLEIGNLREAVNQALVDLHDAQSLAEQARWGAAEARKRLDETQANVERAQEELDEISRSSYRSSGANGTPVHADADARKDSLDRQTYLRKESEDKQRALEDLQRSRTEAANDESTLRQASRLADERAAAAEDAETNARDTLDSSLSALESQLSERDIASSELEQAQTELAEQRPEAAAAMGIGTEDPAQAPAAQSASETEPEAEHSSSVQSAQADETVEPSEAAQPGSSSATESPAVETETGTGTGTETETTAETGTDTQTTSTEEQPTVQSSEADTSESEPAEAATAAEAESSASSAEENSSAPQSSQAPSLEDFANPETVQTALDAFSKAVNQSQAEHASFEDPYQDSASGEAASGDIASPSSSESADEEVAKSDEEEGTDVAGVLPEVDDAEKVSEKLRGTEAASDGSRGQQIEAVIARAESQIGTPYVWGGGDANGATMGLDGQGYNGQAGFDCSGLVLYAYSGAGISLPHYTGYQYQRGTQVPVDQAERGDLLFWGDQGNQHVAIYLGDGMMLEAPQTGMNVQKTAVRRNGLAPMAVRLI